MTKRSRASWDYQALVPLKTVPEWLAGPYPHPDANRPPFTVFDMLIVLGDVQRVTGYQVVWDHCFEGGLTLQEESHLFAQQAVRRSGYRPNATIRLTPSFMGLPPDEEEARRRTNEWVGQLLGMLNACNRMARPPLPAMEVQGAFSEREAQSLWPGPGVGAPSLCDPDTSPWDVLIPTACLHADLGAEEFARRNRTTVAELEAILRTPFVAGFKTGPDYAWSVESFGVLEALIKRRLRVNGYGEQLAFQEGRMNSNEFSPGSKP